MSTVAVPDTGRAVVIRTIARCASQVPNVDVSARVLGEVVARCCRLRWGPACR
jgi:hypothetical protein